jgi:hypothetical protein
VTIAHRSMWSSPDVKFRIVSWFELAANTN